MLKLPQQHIKMILLAVYEYMAAPRCSAKIFFCRIDQAGPEASQDPHETEGFFPRLLPEMYTRQHV